MVFRTIIKGETWLKREADARWEVVSFLPQTRIYSWELLQKGRVSFNISEKPVCQYPEVLHQSAQAGSNIRAFRKLPEAAESR